jgi:hypothetical protein
MFAPIIIPPSGNIVQIVNLADVGRVNFLALVQYAASSSSGVSISEKYGIDIAQNAASFSTLGNPVFDTVTAAYARKTIPATTLSGSVYQGAYQWNFDNNINPSLIQFTFTNNDSTQAATFSLYGDIN